MLVKTRKPIAHGRRGTTLQEMLVVLAILVSLVGTGWPAISGGLGKSQLSSSAKTVRTELAKTRLTAIEAGVPYYFRYQPGGSSYEIAPVSMLGEDVAEIESTLEEAESEEPKLTVIEADLPDGVLFHVPGESEFGEYSTVDVEQPAGEALAEISTGYEEEEWSAPIVFYPNGRTAHAQIVLQNGEGHHIMVTLRGLTGSATVGDVRKAEVEE